MTDLEGEGVEMSILVDPRARWPSCMAMQLLCLAKQCTDKSSYVRPRITEVNFSLYAFTSLDYILLSYLYRY